MGGFARSLLGVPGGFEFALWGCGGCGWEERGGGEWVVWGDGLGGWF